MRFCSKQHARTAPWLLPLILPALGSQGALIAISLGFAACSLLGLPWAAARLRATTLGGVFAAIVLAIAMPRWDLVELTSGSNVSMTRNLSIRGPHATAA